MSRPGQDVILRETLPPRSAPDDTGVWYVVGLTEKGPIDPELVTSMLEFENIYGEEQSYSVLHPSVDIAFREGVARVYVARVVGPAAVNATLNLMDAVAAVALTVTAKNPGEYGNDLRVQVTVTGTDFTLIVSHVDDGVLETSPLLADSAAAVAWGTDTSNYINVTDGPSAADPAVVAATPLAGGADDRASVTDTEWTAALARFSAELGPGQVSMPGRTTTAAHLALLDHAQTARRTAYLDAPDTAVVATLTAAADALRGTSARFGGLFAPWAVVRGTLPGTTRVVPYSAIAAGITARNDRQFTANVAPAGVNGQSTTALDVTEEFTDDERTTLNDAGIIVARPIYGGIRTYGFRSLVDPDADPNWVQLTGSRLYMEVAAEGSGIAENYVFAQFDGKGHKLSEYGGDLVGMLLGFYNEGALFGETADEAFRVDVGPQVNPVSELAEGRVRAIITMRMSPFGEHVVLEIVKARTEEVLS